MKEKLNEIIQLLEQNSSPSNAYIDIAVEDEDYPGIISGNPDGLRLLAAELLRRSIEIEEGYLITADIPDAKWILNDDMPLSITGLKETREKIIENKQNIQDNENKSSFNSWGCLMVALVVAALMVFGIIYLIRLF
jgi:hypothetical protein